MSKHGFRADRTKTVKPRWGGAPGRAFVGSCACRRLTSNRGGLTTECGSHCHCRGERWRPSSSPGIRARHVPRELAGLSRFSTSTNSSTLLMTKTILHTLGQCATWICYSNNWTYELRQCSASHQQFPAHDRATPRLPSGPLVRGAGWATSRIAPRPLQATSIGLCPQW